MHSHDTVLVVLSVLAAVVAGYVALDLAQRAARSSRPGNRVRWLLVAALVMGIGIWSMHFVGMLALDLGFEVAYQPALVALSMVAAVLGAGVALAVVTRPQASIRAVFVGAAFMGLAVAAMHYIGMASMEMPARIEWSGPLVILSLVIAYLASLFALALIFNLHAGQRFSIGARALAALAFGLAVAGLHYTGMLAATFVEQSGTEVAGGADTGWIAGLLAVAAAVMLVALLFGANLDRQRASFARDLTVVAEKMREVVQSDNARETICAAAAELTAARYVALLEPDSGGLLTRTAEHGSTPVEHAAGEAQDAFAAGHHLFRPGESQSFESGALSTLYEPIALDGRPIGVLFFVWPHSLRRLSDRAVTIAGLLAAEASFAIDRAGMLGRLERQASTDELTGLPNRRVVRTELDAQLAAASGEASPLSVVMLDLDHFKTYNDRYGHQGGDRLLIAAAEGWTAQLREPELVGRYGGEEFLVVLPSCSLADAVTTADRLRGALPGGVTCSAGVALWDGVESDETLLGRADEALYEAKRRGRDRTVAAGPDSEASAGSGEAMAAGPVGRFVSEAGVRAFLDGLADPFALLDSDGYVRDWNQASEALFGWSREEAAGRLLTELLDSAEIGEAHRRVLIAGGGSRPDPFELSVHGRDGGEIPVEVRLSVIETEGDAEVVAFIRDISERRATELRLRRFESIIASSDDAVISGSMDGIIETWNPAAERLYGYRADEMIGEDIARLRPAGEPMAADAERRRAIRAGRVAKLESTEQRRDGTRVDVAATIAPLPDEEGTIVGFGAISRDVTARKAAEARLAEAHSQFAGAFDAAAIGMALVSREGRFLAVNPALCALLKRDSEQVIGESFQSLTHPDDIGGDLEQLERLLAGEIDSYRISKRYLLPDGGIVWGLLTVSVVRDADGEPLHFVSQIQDIADRKTAEGELQRYAGQLETLSNQDPLTGLPNRRALTSALSEELAVLAAGGKRSSLLLIAVDGDDAAVAAAARAAAQSARDGDLVAHLGGGELVVLLPAIGPDAAERILGRAEDSMSGHPVRFATATAENGDDPASLLARARDSLMPPPPPDIAVSAPRGVRSLLELARRQLGMPLSFLTRIEDGEYVLEVIAGEPSLFGVREGQPMPLDGTHCVRMLDGRIGSVVHDLAAEPETQDLEVTKALGLRAYAGVPVRLRSGDLYGTLCAVDTHPHPELSERQVELLRFVSELAADAIDAAAEEREARDAATSAVGVRALLVALEARDLYTGEHSKEVVRMASAVARRLGLTAREIRDVEQVALLHDVGKVGIPDAVLQKQGPLSDVEWQLMRQHTVVGERIIVGTPGLSHLAPAMRAEHERWDGGGYPDGLAGEEIPIASRITLACDAFHAMTSERPYRSAMSVERACEELRANAGTQFDPAVAEALLAEIGSAEADGPEGAVRPASLPTGS